MNPFFQLFAGLPSFAYPAALAAFPVAAAALLYVYRRGGDAPRVQVPTLFLLRRYAGRPSARRRVRPPFRFFPELLLALLLTLGAAGLRPGEGRGTSAVVIDTSFGTSAVDGTGRTQLEASAASAAAFVRSLSSGSTVRLFEARGGLFPLSESPVGAAEASRLLDGVKPRFSRDGLEAAVAAVQGLGPFDRVDVFTDRPAAGGAFSGDVTSPARRRGGGRQGAARPVVHTVRAEGTFPNVAVSGAALDPGGPVLTADVVNHSAEAAEVRVVFEGVSGAPVPDRAPAYDVLDVKESIRLSAGGRASVRSAPLGPARAAYRTTVSARDPRADVLAGDDVWHTVPGPRGERVLVVSPSGTTLGLERARPGRAEAATPEAYGARGAPDGTSVVLFHRHVPARFPDTPTLFVAPPPGGGLVAASAPSNAGVVSGWNEAHPLTRYVSLTGFALPGPTVLVPPDWAEPVIRTAAGAVAWAGTEGGKRRAAVGFELLPFEGMRSPEASVLLLNLLGWAEGGGSEGAAPGLVVRVPPATRRLVYPGGREVAVYDGSTPSTALVPEPGLVAAVGGAGTTLLAADYYDPVECSPESPAPFVVPVAEAGRSAAGDGDDGERDDPGLLAAMAAVVAMAAAYVGEKRGGKRSVRTGMT